MAMSRFEIGNRNSAMDAFEICAKIPSTKVECSQWLEYINTQIEIEKKQSEQLILSAEEAKKRKKEQEDMVKRAILQDS